MIHNILHNASVQVIALFVLSGVALAGFYMIYVGIQMWRGKIPKP